MKKKNRHPVSQSSGAINNANSKPPVVSGQCAEVLELLRKHGAVLSRQIHTGGLTMNNRSIRFNAEAPARSAFTGRQP